MSLSIKLLLVVLVATTLITQDGHSEEPFGVIQTSSGLTFTDVWAKAGKPDSAISMKIKNNMDLERKIVSVTTKTTDQVQLQDHVKEGDILKPRKIENIVIPPNGTVELAPEGKQIALLQLSRGLNPGQNIQITLHLSDHTTIHLNVPVKKMG